MDSEASPEPRSSAEDASAQVSDSARARAERCEGDAHAGDVREAEAREADVRAGDVREAEGATPVSGETSKARTLATKVREWLMDYFFGEEPSFGVALVPFCFLSMLLFTRHPRTNFIFDEQEALLANAYVRSVADPTSGLGWIDAFRRDFWGLPPSHSIGSYRPVPDLVWRVLWALGAREQTPFLHHWVNVLLHGVNGALVAVLAFALTKHTRTAWLAGACFTACAVLTEAVSGVVGIADVLGATGLLAALLALRFRMPWMAIAVFVATLFGLYSKESALAAVPIVPLFALASARTLHPSKPRTWARGVVAFVATLSAFVFYVEVRRRMFPAPIPTDLSIEVNASKPWAPRTFAAILRWYAQPTLPKDPLNNPLVGVDSLHRIGGALRVYLEGLVQLVFPHPLSGDYSAPSELPPESLFEPGVVLGALAFVLPFPVALWLGLRARRTPTPDGVVDRRPLVAACLVTIVLSYFPVSNIPVLLPTIRAERFWYFPAIGSGLLLAMAFSALLDRFPKARAHAAVVSIVVAFFVVQGIAARAHANDYTNDLTFWDATRKAVPRSAKAHLNYSVMKGARGDLEARLAANRTALELAPKWPMANVYLGDTLCRLHRTAEAWPHYVDGFRLAPNDSSLIALALQCLWDEKALAKGSPIWSELEALVPQYPHKWVEYLGRNILEHGEEYGGVEPKYRPRGYNEGPKKE